MQHGGKIQKRLDDAGLDTGLVYICSPLRGAIEENIKKAHRYCEYASY